MPTAPPKYPPYTARMNCPVRTVRALIPTERPSRLLSALEKWRPKARITVAKASSHGAAASNDAAGNASSRPAPRAPPSRLIADSAFVDVGPTGTTSRRYTHALATAPGTRATRDNAFAVTGGTP